MSTIMSHLSASSNVTTLSLGIDNNFKNVKSNIPNSIYLDQDDLELFLAISKKDKNVNLLRDGLDLVYSVYDGDYKDTDYKLLEDMMAKNIIIDPKLYVEGKSYLIWYCSTFYGVKKINSRNQNRFFFQKSLFLFF